MLRCILLLVRQTITAWVSQSISDNSVSSIWVIRCQMRISLSYRNFPRSEGENRLWGIEKESPGNQNHITWYSDALTASLAVVTICLTKAPYSWKVYFGLQFQVHLGMEVMVAGTWGYLVTLCPQPCCRRTWILVCQGPHSWLFLPTFRVSL